MSAKPHQSTRYLHTHPEPSERTEVVTDHDEMRRLADAFRHAADNPAETGMPAKWVEGFTDGLRFAATAMDVIASGDLTPSAIDAAVGSLR
jgi:hypothetical protein